jgi:hypothetical protein
MGTLLLTVLLAVTAQTQAAGQPPPAKEKSPEELVMERVQKLVVRTLDGSLPERTLQAWLKEVFGPTATTTWQLAACDAPSGNPQGLLGGESPLCVDAAVSLDARRVLHLVFAVTIPKPGARVLPPAFSYGVVMDGGASTRWIKSLGEASRIR